MARKPKDTTPKPSEWAGATDDAFDVLLTKEEQVQAAKEAKEEIAAEQKALAIEEYKAQIKDLEKKKNLFYDAAEGDKDAGKVAVFFNLPLMSPHTVRDGRKYIPGRTYHVNEKVAADLLETMARNYEHDASLQGPERMAAYRKKQRYSQPSHVG